MKRGIINSDYEIRMKSHKRTMSLREWWLSRNHSPKRKQNWMRCYRVFLAKLSELNYGYHAIATPAAFAGAGERSPRRGNPPLDEEIASHSLRSARNDMQTARLASHKGMISLRELQSQTGEELDAL